MVAREYAILGRETDNDEYLDRTDSAIERATALIDELVAAAHAPATPDFRPFGDTTYLTLDSGMSTS